MAFDEFGFWDENLDGKADLEDVLLIDDYDDEFNSDYSDDSTYSDDDDDDDDSLDDESDEFEDYKDSSGETTLNISISVGDSTEDKINTGYRKYYHDDIWYINNALIDHFPELLENYDAESNIGLEEMISEIYYYAPEKAIEYLCWVINFFPAYALDRPDDFVNYNYHLRVEPLSRLFYCCNKENGIILRDAILNNSCLVDAFFGQVTWIKHKLNPLRLCLSFFVRYKLFEEAFKLYDAYILHQAGRYTPRDLSELWSSTIVLDLDFGCMNKSEKEYVSNKVQGYLDKLLPISKKAIDELKEKIKHN